MNDMQQDGVGGKNPLDEFVDRLLDEKNLPDLPEAVVKEMRQDLVKRLNDTLNAKVIAAMSDEQVEKFNQMMDADASDEEVQKYVESTIDEPENFVAGVMLEFRRSYLGLA